MTLISAVGLRIYAGYVDRVYPIEDWLAWPLLKVWGYVALLNLAWFSAGNWTVGKVLGLRDLPLLERAVLSTAVGVVIFVQLMYVAGALGWYTPAFAIVLALAMIAVGVRELLELGRLYRQNARTRPPLRAWTLLLWGIGGALTLVIYLGVLSPDALNYDSTWCHLTVSQDYAREGGIVPFPGDYNKAVPQLAGLIHTWDYLVPGLPEPALRWMLALHQEFGLFLWTLAGVAAAVRCMLGDARLPGTWLSFYLFPIIFVYDNGLGGAADHIAAFFALPGVVAAKRLLDQLTWPRALVMAACMAGGMLTKYQCFYWVLPTCAVVGAKLSWHTLLPLLQKAPRETLKPLGRVWLVVLVCLPALISPHFVKNWIFYRDPVYPLAQEIFRGARPTVDNGVFLVNHVFTDVNWVPRGTFVERALHALELTLKFSFEPHYSFTKNFPAFGSLFTLLLPALVFVRRRAPLLLGAFVGMCALFAWGYTFNVDRNLQIFSPILVATTGALLVEIWRSGWLARVALTPLVAFQLLWGADAVFYSSQDRIRPAFDLIASGYAGNAKNRFDRYRSAFVALGKALPPDATVMLHTSHVSLGIDRRVYLDWAGFQGLIGYSKVKTARELYDMYKSVGLTHVLYVPGERPAASIQEEIVFQTLLPSLPSPLSTAGGYRLQALPAEPPAPERPYKVLTLGLHGYGSGVFSIEQLSTNEYIDPAKRRYAKPSEPVPSDAELDALDVDAVVVGARTALSPEQSAFLRRGFASAVQYSGQQTAYLRKRAEREQKR